jgi:hypothetical protein
LRPFGGSEQAKAIIFAFAAPLKMRVLVEAGVCLRTRTASKPSSASYWRARVTVPILVYIEGCCDLAVAPSVAGFQAARLRQNAGSGQLPGRVLAGMDQGVKAIPLLLAEFHHMPFHGNTFQGRKVPPSLLSNRFGD